MSVLHFGPCYNPHKCPGRTWGPDFLFKLSNVMPDFQFKKIVGGGFTNELVKEDNSTDRHSTRTSSWPYVPYPDRLKLRLRRDDTTCYYHAYMIV